MPSTHEYLASRGLDPDRVIPAWHVRVERSRLVLPWMGWSGQELGWSARALDDHMQPKYLNSPGFPRRLWLYGLHQPRQRIPVLVEGPFDAIALWSAGFTAYAVGGSDITLVQAAHVAGWTGTAILYPDQPKPGHPVIALGWISNLARMGVSVVLPPDPFPPGSEEADPSWLYQHARDYLTEQVEQAIMALTCEGLFGKIGT